MTKSPQSLRTFINTYWFVILSTVIVLSVVAFIEHSLGRSAFGPDGHFGWWDNNIWGNENSQRVADAYSFSHIIHGMLFYGVFWLISKRLPERFRNGFDWRYWFVGSLVIEGCWELLENSPLIINRYREATIALGYVGDSVLNSVCDVVMVMIGFMIARFSKLWMSVMLIVILEIGCLFWIRDNLTLNVIMLVHPVESIKVWQSEGH